MERECHRGSRNFVVRRFLFAWRRAMPIAVLSAVATALLSAISAIPAASAFAAQPAEAGIRLVYEFEPAEGITAETFEKALRTRLDAFTAGRHTIKLLDDGKSLEIVLPALPADQLAKCKKLISAPGLLLFRIMAIQGVHDDVIRQADLQPKSSEIRDPDGKRIAHWASYDPDDVQPNEKVVTRLIEATRHEALLIDDDNPLGGDDLQEVHRDRDSLGHPALGGELTAAGAAKMLQLSRANLPDPISGLGRQLAIVLDGVIMSAPTIRAEIGSKFLITGNFSQADADHLVHVLRAGRLPGKLRGPITETKLDPQP